MTEEDETQDEYRKCLQELMNFIEEFNIHLQMDSEEDLSSE